MKSLFCSLFLTFALQHTAEARTFGGHARQRCASGDAAVCNSIGQISSRWSTNSAFQQRRLQYHQNACGRGDAGSCGFVQRFNSASPSDWQNLQTAQAECRANPASPACGNLGRLGSTH